MGIRECRKGLPLWLEDGWVSTHHKSPLGLIKKQQLQSWPDLPSIERRRVMLEMSSNGWIMNRFVLFPSLGIVYKKIHLLFAYQPTSLCTHSSRTHHTYFSHYPQLHSPPNPINTLLSPPLSFKPILLTHHYALPGQARNGYALVLTPLSITNTPIYHTYCQQPKPITILTS